MNAQQAENLRVLIRHMETGCNRTLNMNRVSTGCGTPACAFGEACTLQPFQALGLELLPRDAGYSVLFFGTETHISAPAKELFGVVCQGDHGDYPRLFGAAIGNAWGRANVTPQEWAVEARKVLTKRGYSMHAAPKPDAFAAFMAKVQEPVAVTA